jgi:hypothetical protein
MEPPRFQAVGRFLEQWLPDVVKPNVRQIIPHERRLPDDYLRSLVWELTPVI